MYYDLVLLERKLLLILYLIIGGLAIACFLFTVVLPNGGQFSSVQSLTCVLLFATP